MCTRLQCTVEITLLYMARARIHNGVKLISRWLGEIESVPRERRKRLPPVMKRGGEGEKGTRVL